MVEGDGEDGQRFSACSVYFVFFDTYLFFEVDPLEGAETASTPFLKITIGGSY